MHIPLEERRWEPPGLRGPGRVADGKASERRPENTALSARWAPLSLGAGLRLGPSDSRQALGREDVGSWGTRAWGHLAGGQIPT